MLQSPTAKRVNQVTDNEVGKKGDHCMVDLKIRASVYLFFISETVSCDLYHDVSELNSIEKRAPSTAPNRPLWLHFPYGFNNYCHLGDVVPSLSLQRYLAQRSPDTTLIWKGKQA